jgi:DNA topoisomerase-1
MRTDSTRVGDEAYRQGVACIKQLFGEETVSAARRSFKKTKLAQDAHEAIRPTDCSRTPDAVASFLAKDQLALYRLVWQRFLASLAASAVYATRDVDVAAGKRFLLRANGRRLVKPGYLAIMPDQRPEDDEVLPETAVGEELSVRSMEGAQHFTEPPPRYTEASLIKELEENGVGRPSTYATILGIIQARDYVNKKAGVLHPTELGEKVWNTLDRFFRDVFEIDFTARMETELDKVEEEKEDWRTVVRQFYDPLDADLGQFKDKKLALKSLVQEETEELCKNCGRKLVKKWSRNGPFLACPGYPECRYTRPIEGEQTLERACPKCGGALVYKTGRFGKFIACGKYPECKYTEAISLGLKCPGEGCGGDVIEKRTRRGRVFYGCSKYPACTYASWDKPTSQLCPHCSKALLVEKESTKKGRYLRCPSCKSEVAP